MSSAAPLDRHRGNGITDDVRALLQARAERLKARLVSKADEPTLMVAQFRVGDAQYAIPLASFRAAVPLKLIRPIPLSPPEVVGIFRYQGQITTALSLAALLGVRGWRTDPTVLLVVEAAAGKLVGLDCEEIPKPCPLPLAAIEKARARETGPIVELFLAGATCVNLIDLGALLDRKGWTRNGP